MAHPAMAVTVNVWMIGVAAQPGLRVQGATVDGYGECCSTGAVDACGVCGGARCTWMPPTSAARPTSSMQVPALCGASERAFQKNIINPFSRVASDSNASQRPACMLACCHSGGHAQSCNNSLLWCPTVQGRTFHVRSGCAGGLCCASGVLDECGVCDGDSSSCALQATVQVQVDPLSHEYAGFALQRPLLCKEDRSPDISVEDCSASIQVPAALCCRLWMPLCCSTWAPRRSPPPSRPSWAACWGCSRAGWR